MLDWHGAGCSVMGNEPPRQGIHRIPRAQAEATAQTDGHSAGYKVLFLQGGATCSSRKSMNLLAGVRPTTSSRFWSKGPPKRNGWRRPLCAATTETVVSPVCRWPTIRLDPFAAYLHLSQQNPFIHGAERITSTPACRRRRHPPRSWIGRFPLKNSAGICPGAQKNIGSGLRLVHHPPRPARHGAADGTSGPRGGRARLAAEHAADPWDLSPVVFPVAKRQGGLEGPRSRRKGAHFVPGASISTRLLRESVVDCRSLDERALQFTGSAVRAAFAEGGRPRS